MKTIIKTQSVVMLCAVAFAVCCTPLQRTTSGQWMPGVERIERASVFLLPVPDGSEREEGPATGSGAAMTAALRDNLIARGRRVFVSEKAVLSSALDDASAAGFVYLLKAQLTEWEDNATEWSSRPDSAALSAELYEVATRQLVASATHRIVASSAAAFARTPDRFIPELAEHVLMKILGGVPRVYTDR